MKYFFIAFFAFTSVAFSQGTPLDERFLKTHRTLANPISFPVAIDSKGEISLFGEDTTSSFLLRPTFQLGVNLENIEYSRPVVTDHFNFYPVIDNISMVEIKRQRFEGGLGLTTLIKSVAKVGLAPYQGSMQTVIRSRPPRSLKNILVLMPRELKDLQKWEISDVGFYQTYGGVSFYAELSSGIFDIVSGSIGLQNEFMVEISKISENHIILKISEEDLKRRQLLVGPFFSKVSFGKFSGKRFSTEYKLDIRDPQHHKLFRLALRGELSKVQLALDVKNQDLSWSGMDKGYYFGLPFVAGRSYQSGHYEIQEDHGNTRLDFEGYQNRGVLAATKNIHDFVYQTDKGMVVMWSSEMKKTSQKNLFERFLSKGRILGVKGFERNLPNQEKFGTVVTQMGIYLSRQEIEGVSENELQQLEGHLRLRCEKEELKCRKEKNLTRIMNKLMMFKKMKWADFSGPLGLLLLKEPAVIHALVKTKSYKKEVYFKFLSDSYQSLEGASPIEIPARRSKINRLN
jgi:hypothetical protein